MTDDNSDEGVPTHYVIPTELELTISRVSLDGSSIKEFHIRACSHSEDVTIRMMDRAIEKYAMQLRTLESGPQR